MKQTVLSSGVYPYHPELGEQKPDCQIEARIAYYRGHWLLATPLELKGRGIRHLKTYTEKDLNTYGQYKIGWNQYQVTPLAFDKIKEQYSISIEALLD